jgi:hypothetical protein
MPLVKALTPLAAVLMLDEKPVTVVERDVTLLVAVETPDDSDVI